jgi:hypothetical protein
LKFDFEIVAIAMKMIIFKHLWRIAVRVPLLLGILLAVFLTSSGMAAPTVTTLTGGPSQANKKFFGYVDGDTKALAQFHTPIGLAFDSSRTTLVVADRDNNVIRLLDLAGNLTATFDIADPSLLDHPVGVTVNSFNEVFVLNAGDGSNGSVVVFDNFGDYIATPVTDLFNATGIALDGGDNVYVTANNDTVLMISPGGTVSTVATINASGTVLQGIAVLASGNLAVTDSGNHGIYLINSVTHAVSALTGFNGAGDHFGNKFNAQLNFPYGISEAGSGVLVVADQGNHRVKVVDPFGTVTNLYGVSSNLWVQGSGNQGIYPGWWDGTVCSADTFGCVEARLPAGVIVAPDGSVYTSEDYYHLLRHVTATGLPGPGGGGGTGTNVVSAPIISPNSGYYPMGRLITVTSPNPNVRYTTDGTEPTLASPAVTMNGNVGFIHWFNSTNDLTGLKVKAFIGTNASETVTGRPALANNVGTPPGPADDGTILGGIGSTIVVPVVANLRTNDQVRSYQFRVEVTPNGGAPMIPPGFNALDVSTNDFVRIVTPVQGGGAITGGISVVSYNIGTTMGLQVTAIGNSGNIQFQRFAVVALLKIPIPPNANEGDTYSVSVSFPSATSDGVNTPVSLTPMAAATIVVNNVAYTIGDTASPFGAWYNAGTFGDGELENADVNNAFYAAVGLRVPYAFSDVYNAMDAYPPDMEGFVGGDGQIRFLDWQVILLRSLRLDTNNWSREWSPGGNLINNSTTLGFNPLGAGGGTLSSDWYRQVLVGGNSVGNVTPGHQVNIPVYVKLGNGSTLSGLQFRAVVEGPNGAPVISQSPQFIVAPGVTSPSMQQTSQANSTAFGWSLGSFNFQSRSSNFLGWLRFNMPAGATSGQNYRVSFANADGAPNVSTQYDFESRSAFAGVNIQGQPTSICSDEWKQFFFGSLTDVNALDSADPDGDGASNGMEYLAGTIPTAESSKLQFTATESRIVNGQRQFFLHWLTAPGKAYELQWSASPSGGAWNILGTVSGDGTETIYTDSGAALARYYRLRVLP